MYGIIFRLVWPFLQRLLAKGITDYLEKRREQRLQAQGGKEANATLLAEQAPALSRFTTVDAVWFTLSGVLLGSAISLILAQIFLREE